MRLGITAKLFLVILASCAVVLLVNGLAAQFIFQRNFIGYLNEQGTDRMETVLPRLSACWQQHGNWEFVRGDLQGWFKLVRPEPDPARLQSGPPMSDQTGAVNRFALLDRDYSPVVGHPGADRDSVLRPVVVGGQTVGWLAMVPFQKAIGTMDVRFYETQRRMWWATGVVSVAVAALLAGLLARTLLRRMYRLADATHGLAAGRYGIRIPAGSRDEIDALGRDFNRLAQALEHNEQNRRIFMADISHELRTPLAVMRAEVEAMQDGIRPMERATLRPLEGQILRLGKLVDDLHDLSMTDVGALTYERVPLDLCALLCLSLTEMADRFEAAGIGLHRNVSSGGGHVLGDERRLHQLFDNLLENSLRYTAAGGMVEVRCERQGGFLLVTLDDSPPGVDEAQLARLFERFYRAGTVQEGTVRGSGLGLAICRNIVAAHDGEIFAERSPLGGLRIGVRLPEIQ